MLSKDQIIEAIASGNLFFAKLPNGDFVARYTRHDTVQQVTSNGLKPLPVQGDDLCWLIQATDENSDH